MKRAKYILISITVGCVAVMIVSVKFPQYTDKVKSTIATPLAPVQKVLTSVGGWFEDKFSFVIEARNYAIENEQLQKRVSELENEVRNAEITEQEVKDLRNKLQFTQSFTQYKMIGAEVIARDPSNWTDYILIDKGSKDGIKKNMVVLTEKGLVGLVEEVRLNSCKVRTILNEENNVSVEVKRTKDFGVLVGDRTVSSSNQASVEYVDPTAQLVTDDEIITSGLGGIYPRGIYVGKIIEVNKDSDKTTKVAKLQSEVDFSKLDKVLIINQVWEKFDLKQ